MSLKFNVESILLSKIRSLMIGLDELEKFKATLKLDEAIALWSSGRGE